MAFRLVASLIVVGGLATALGWTGARQIWDARTLVEGIGRDSAHHLTLFARLSRETTGILADLTELVARRDAAARAVVVARMEQSLEAIGQTLPSLAGDEADTAPEAGLRTDLVRHAAEFRDSLRAVAALLDRREAQAAELDSLLARVSLLPAAVREAASRDAPAPDGESRRHVWGDSVQRALMIMMSLPQAGDPAAVAARRAAFLAAMDEAQAAPRRNPGARTGDGHPVQDILAAINDLGAGASDVFAARAKTLAADDELALALDFCRGRAGRLLDAVAAYASAAEADLGATSAGSVAGLRRGEWLLGAGLALFLGTLLAVAVLNQRTARRLLHIRQALDTGGEALADRLPDDRHHDEIGAMVRALRGFTVQITRREHDLRESERRLRAIFECSPVGAAIVDDSGTVLFANARAADLAGVPIDRFIGARHPSLGGASSPTLHRPRIQATVRPTLFEGRPARLVWTIDVSERARAEDALKEARDAAEELARARSEFLATVSHEFRTPLNGILGAQELLALTRLDPDQANLLATAREAGSALRRVIDEVLDLSRIETGRFELEILPLSPADIIEDVAGQLAAQAARKGLTLVTDAAADVPHHLCGDPDRLRQVLRHLAANAIAFTERGHVVLRTMVVGTTPAGATRIRFEVDDTGVGISAEGQAQLLQPYGPAADSSAAPPGGTGLGLAIAARLVERMGGRIGVSSVPDKGSTFWFVVALNPSPPDVPSDEADLAGVACLVVDSDPVQRNAVIHALERCRATTIEATRIEEAVELADGEIIDAVISGARLTDGTAAELLARLGAPPAVLLLGEGDKVTFPDGRLERVERPVRRRALATAVARLLGRPLPADDVRADADPALPEAPQPGPDSETTILVAEDHPVNRQIIERQLRRLGHAALVVDDGMSALAAWRVGDFHLIITDCHMPRMDGYELARQIRAAEGRDPTRRRTPIAALTTNAFDGQMERCLAAGMDDFIAKPVSLRRLAEVIGHWIDSPSRSPLPDVPGAAPNGLPALDRDHIVATFGGIDQGTLALLEYFLETSVESIHSMTDPRTEATESLREAAHKAAGAARTAGALRLGAALSRLEQAVVDHDEAALISVRAEIGSELPRVVAAIAALGAELDAGAADAKPSAEPAIEAAVGGG